MGDSSHVALVSLLLRESAFTEFKCERPTSLGMNVESLAKILKMCGPSDSLKIQWKGGADTVGFQCESGADDRIADFDLKLMQIESEHMEIPEQQYKVTVRLPSAEFQKICRDLKEFGETMQIKATKKVALTVHEPVTATFALRYLVNFAKAAPLCGAVELGLGPDAPLLVKYELEKAENGFMQFYLAPKIDE